MSRIPKPAVPDIRVPDAAEAMRKTIDFVRRALSVPKAEIDAAREKPAAKGKKKSADSR
jgi:hypothetical protein